jgi:nucleotide-binding universal stress UspA family protein
VYRKILLTLDGSDVAREAVPHARELARALGAEITLLQVVDSVGHLLAQTATVDPIAAGGVTADVAGQAVAAQRTAAQEYLAAVQQELRGAGVEAVRTEIREGRPTEEIEAAVRELGCDLVVMATRGRSGLRRAVLGSVADHVARHTPGAPVLLVHLDPAP